MDSTWLLERAAALIDSSDDAIISKTLDGFITSWNRGAERLFGYAAEEIIGQHISVLAPPGRVDETPEILSRLRRGERFENYETERLTKSGETVVVSATISPITDSAGNIVGASKIARDITARRDAEVLREGQLAVARAFDRHRTADAAFPEIFEAVAPRYGWDLAQFWLADTEGGTLRCVSSWTAPDIGMSDAPPFGSIRTLSRSVGKAGRVWDESRPRWLPDVMAMSERTLVRKSAAGRLGLHGACILPLRTKTETIGVLEFYSRAVRRPNERIHTAMMAIAVQIAELIERRQNEEAIRNSEEQFRLLLNSTAEGIYGLDVQGRCTFINSSAARMLGYADPQQLVGVALHVKTHHTRADGSHYPLHECRIYMAFMRGEGTHVDDEVFWRADGTSFPVEYWSYPIRKDGVIVGAVVAFLDVTERRAARRAIEESEQRFRRLCEASFDGIVVSEAGILEQANPGLAAMLGYDEKAVIGMSVLAFTAPESLEIVRERVEGQIEGRYEFVGQKKNGDRIMLEATTRLHDVNGRVKRITALRDLTEKRKLEDQFRHAQKMEAVGRLAGGIAHDFNNLLTVISAHADFVRQEVSPQSTIAEDIDDIRKAADDAAGLTRQLLAFSRQQVIEPRPVALHDVVAKSERLLRRVIGEDIRFEYSVKHAAAVVNMDPGQIEQIILNLAVNARDAMPDGGRLTIETGIVTLDEAYISAEWPAISGQFGLLAVSDDGTGMDDATKARIFEPFFTTKPVGRGTGLGLSTVYGIVKQNGGSIWVYSEVGKGTTFKIFFPISDATPVEPQPQGSAPASGTETILLAEDDAAVRAVTKSMLERYGYTVLAAATGQAALALLATNEIDLLLTDVIMPGMNGRDLAERFSAIRPGLKVLFLSGYTDETIVRHGVLDPGMNYLAKPYSPERLARKIRGILDPTSPDTSGP